MAKKDDLDLDLLCVPVDEDDAKDEPHTEEQGGASVDMGKPDGAVLMPDDEVASAVSTEVSSAKDNSKQAGKITPDGRIGVEADTSKSSSSTGRAAGSSSGATSLGAKESKPAPPREPFLNPSSLRHTFGRLISTSGLRPFFPQIGCNCDECL